MKKIVLTLLSVLITSSMLINACTPVATPVPSAVPNIETPIIITPPELNSSTATPSDLGKYMIPEYYQQAYISMVENSKNEDGLVIYSIMAAENWNPIIDTFNSHYPWIKVTTEDLSASEVFTRYYDETQNSVRTADILISSDPISWLDFFNKKEVASYQSQEDSYIPDWSKSVYGTYTVSSDPMVIIYNNKLVSSNPKSIGDLAALVKSDPEGYKNQVVTYDAELNATGFAINWFWTDIRELDGWINLNTLGQSQPLLMTSGGGMVDAVGKGDAKLGYFVSAITVLPRLETYPDLSWSYITDGQPILLRNMAMTQRATSPNSASLMIDFILSQEGQYALSLGGLTPYRSDISGISQYHLDKISAEVGEDNLILFSFDARLVVKNTRDSFIEKWKAAVHKISLPTPSPTP